MSVHKQNRGGRAQNGDITSNDTNPLIAPIRAQQVSCFERYGSPAQPCAAATLPVGHAQGLCAMFQGVRDGHLRGDWWRNARKFVDLPGRLALGMHCGCCAGVVEVEWLGAD